MTSKNNKQLRELDKLFDIYYPLGKVKPNDEIDKEKAIMMTRIMEHHRNKFKEAILSLLKAEKRELLESLEEMVKEVRKETK